MIFTNICITCIYCLYIYTIYKYKILRQGMSLVIFSIDFDRSDPIDCKASLQACASERRSEDVRNLTVVFQLPCFMFLVSSRNSTRICSIPPSVRAFPKPGRRPEGIVLFEAIRLDEILGAAKKTKGRKLS